MRNKMYIKQAICVRVCVYVCLPTKPTRRLSFKRVKLINVNVLCERRVDLCLHRRVLFWRRIVNETVASVTRADTCIFLVVFVCSCLVFLYWNITDTAQIIWISGDGDCSFLRHVIYVNCNIYKIAYVYASMGKTWVNLSVWLVPDTLAIVAHKSTQKLAEHGGRNAQ